MRSCSTTVGYIAANPVTAGLAPDPAGWLWGSHRALVGLDDAPSWLAVDELQLDLLAAQGGDGGKRYRELVDDCARQDDGEAAFLPSSVVAARRAGRRSHPRRFLQPEERRDADVADRGQRRRQLEKLPIQGMPAQHLEDPTGDDLRHQLRPRWHVAHGGEARAEELAEDVEHRLVPGRGASAEHRWHEDRQRGQGGRCGEEVQQHAERAMGCRGAVAGLLMKALATAEKVCSAPVCSASKTHSSSVFQ